MPIYEYRCETCGHEFERLLKIGADAPACPACDANTRKKVSASGFVLKGSGWYKDHYGLKKGTSTKEGGSTPKADPKPAEAKPAETKTPTKQQAA